MLVYCDDILFDLLFYVLIETKAWGESKIFVYNAELYPYRKNIKNFEKKNTENFSVFSKFSVFFS